MHRIVVSVPTPNRFGEAEIQHLYPALRVYLNVGRLEVAMNDPFLMCRRKRVCDLTRIIEGLPDGQRTLRALALHQFEYKTIYLIGFFEAVNGGDVWMIQ